MAMNMNFAIRRIGEGGYPFSDDEAHPHRHRDFELAYFVQGNGRLCVQPTEHPISARTVVCIPPQRLHCLRPGEDARGYLLSFSSQFVHNAGDGGDLLVCSNMLDAFTVHLRVLQLNAAFSSELEDILAMLCREYESCLPRRTEVLSGLLKIFLVCLARLPGFAEVERPRNRKAVLTGDFFSLLEKEYMSKRMVADYAENLSVTPSYLNEAVKSVSGYPASHHIQQRVILEAKRLVTYSDVPMKEIAFRLGFVDISHFSKFFKNFAGVNFRAFRKNGNEDHSGTISAFF